MSPGSRDKSKNQPERIKKDKVSTAVAPPSAFPSIDELLARLDRRDVHEMNPAPVKGVLSDYGQIHAIDLPYGWIESDKKHVSGVGTRSFRMFHPPDVPAVMLCFYYRGLRISAAAGENFRKLLDQPAHRLTAPEIASITTVIRDKSDPKEFAVADARTEDSDKRRVLIVEGNYVRSGEKVINVFVDTDGSGTAVQEIYFQAPSNQYSDYFSTAKAAIYSIKWK